MCCEAFVPNHSDEVSIMSERTEVFGETAAVLEVFSTTCPVCGSLRKVKISSLNAEFLCDRTAEGNVDDAVTLSRICWNNFPQLRLSSDSKAIIGEFMMSTKRWFEDQAKQILNPLSDMNKTLTTTITALSTLSTSLPEDLKPHLSVAIQQLDSKMQLVESALKSSLDSLRQDIGTIEEQFRKINYKPTEKGQAGQTSTETAWIDMFPNDKVTLKGGPGESDLLVEPYLGDGKHGHLGSTISIERKAGKQSFTSGHLHEAVKHAKREGSKYVMLIYDCYENLMRQPMRIDRIDGILYTICEFESNSWKTARQLIGLLQENEPAVDSQIDLVAIRKTVEDMAQIEAAKAAIERENEKAWKANDNIRQKHLPALDQALKEYATKLQQLIEGQ
jgi:hypothetical protein